MKVRQKGHVTYHVDRHPALVRHGSTRRWEEPGHLSLLAPLQPDQYHQVQRRIHDQNIWQYRESLFQGTSTRVFFYKKYTVCTGKNRTLSVTFSKV